MATSQNPNDGLDLIGIGKLAEAIPDEVYNRTTESLVTTSKSSSLPSQKQLMV